MTAVPPAKLARRLLVVLLLSFLIRALNAHAILLNAWPGPDQVVRGPDVTVRLEFNSRIDTKRSRLVLVSATGEERSLSINGKAPRDCVKSEVTGISAGAYVLLWQVLATDGHISRGKVPFRVQSN